MGRSRYILNFITRNISIKPKITGPQRRMRLAQTIEMATVAFKTIKDAVPIYNILRYNLVIDEGGMIYAKKYECDTGIAF